MERFFAKKYAACLFNNKIRFPILIATLGMLGTCIYGATQLRLDFDISFLYTDYVRTFENIKNEYSDTVGDIVHIYTGKFDYQTVENQKYMAQLFETSGDLGTSKWVVEESIDSWQINFRTFALLETIESTLEPNEYYIKLKEFLSHPAGSRFVNDIIFDTSTGIPQIAATRSSFLSVFLKNNDIQADFMQSMREILNSSKLPEAFPFTYFFIYYEQYLVLVAEAFQIVFSALLVVFIVTFILISNPLTSIIVLLGVGFSVIDILGLLHFWDINLNSVSVIVLSLAVGLTIDSAAHMGLGFMESVGTRRERIVLSLKHLGPPILHGSTSTLIAISALIPAEGYVLKTFFKIFFLIITFGAFHGFVVVPILLDLFGPKSNYNSEEEKNLQITV